MAVLVAWLAIVAPAAAQPLAPAAAGDEPPLVIDRWDALDLRWTVALDQLPIAPAGFDETAAYVPLRDGTLVAVGLERGERRWTASPSALSTPATGWGFVYTSTAEGIVALHAADGGAAWAVPLPDPLAAPLYWDTGWLVAATERGDLLAFRASDGTLVWRRTLGSPIVTAPSPALDRLYVALADGRVVSLDLATGASRWERKLDGRTTGLLALDRQVVAGTTGNAVFSLDALDGRIRWRWRVGADVAGAAAADEDHIYFAALDLVVRAVDRGNGNLQWTQPLKARPAGGPVRAADVVLVPLVSTEVSGFHAETGTPALTITAAGEQGSRPHVRFETKFTGTRVITLSRDGSLQGFRARVEPPPTPLADLPGTPVEP